MMFRRNGWLAALILLTIWLPVTRIQAQTAEADDARAVFLSAMHGLLTDSYHYASETQITSIYTGGDGQAQTVVNLMAADGDVAPQGDNHMTITSAGGESVAAVRAAPRAAFERIVADGVVYLKVTDEVKQVVQLEVDSGWYRLDDLLAKLDNTALRLGLENLARIAMPAKLPVDDRFVLDVTEVAPEWLDGVEVRVFDVRLDGKGVALAQMPGSATDKLAELFKNRALYAASTFDYTARVWVSRDGGKVLKLHVESHTALPYLTVSGSTGVSGGPGYDIDIVVSSNVTLTHYGEPVEIEAPVTVE